VREKTALPAANLRAMQAQCNELLETRKTSNDKGQEGGGVEQKLTNKSKLFS
jgi:hypothetical protein